MILILLFYLQLKKIKKRLKISVYTGFARRMCQIVLIIKVIAFFDEI